RKKPPRSRINVSMWKTFSGMVTLMSKGPGRIQRTIDAIFKDNPDSAFTVEELCSGVYGYGKREKRHRVAVIRAAKAVAKNLPDIVVWNAEWRGGTLIFFNHRSIMSYAIARLKG